MKKNILTTILMPVLMLASSVLFSQTASNFVLYPSGEVVSKNRIAQLTKNKNANVELKKVSGNNPPVAQNDTAYVCINSGVTTIHVQNNDHDPDGNTFSTNIFAGTINGSFSLNGNSIDYTPNTGYIGTDTLVYYICDNGTPSLCDTATVFIHVVLGFTTSVSASICNGDSLFIAGAYTTIGGIFTQTLTASGGCDSIIVTTVSVTPSPTVTISPSAPTICAGSSVTLTASGANAYAWLPATNLSVTSGSVVVASPTTTTTYSVAWTSGSCSGTQTVQVTVTPSPTIIVTPPAATICTGSSTTLTASGATTYSWSPAVGLSTTTGSVVTANLTNTATYTVMGTSSGCVATQTVQVTVTPNLTISITPSSPTICAGSSTTLTASGATSYSWSPATGLSATTGSVVTANPTNTTTYTTTWVNGGCVGSQTVQVTVTPTPTVTITSSSPTVCLGNSTTLTASGATSYSWSPATGLSATTGSVVVANPTNTTTYTSTWVSGSCSNTETVVVNVTPTPTVIITPTSPTICAGSSATLTASGATTYSWSPASGLSTTSGSVVIASPTNTTTYTTNWTSGACAGTETVMVTVTPPSTASITPSGATTFCQGNSVILNANTASSYTWSSGETTQSITVTTAGTYSVMVSNGCGTANATPVTITVNPSPTVAISQSGVTTFCKGDSVTLTSSSATSYLWSTGATTQNITVHTSGNYSVTITDGNHCAATSLATTVTVNQTPTANFAYNQTSATSFSFTNTSTNATTYVWNFGNGQTSTSINPTNTYATTGSYIVTLIALNTCGTDTSRQPLQTIDFVIYNGFSPNGDGHNDTWDIPALNYYANNSVKILNRWGSEVWLGNNYDNKNTVWAGKNMTGDDLPDGTYYYIINYNNTDKRGWVIIKR